MADMMTFFQPIQIISTLGAAVNFGMPSNESSTDILQSLTRIQQADPPSSRP